MTRGAPLGVRSAALFNKARVKWNWRERQTGLAFYGLRFFSVEHKCPDSAFGFVGPGGARGGAGWRRLGRSIGSPGHGEIPFPLGVFELGVARIGERTILHRNVHETGGGIERHGLPVMRALGAGREENDTLLIMGDG